MKRLYVLITTLLAALFLLAGCDQIQGVGVADAFIEDDVLMLELTDGSTVAAGNVHKDIELAIGEEGLEWRYEDEEEWDLIAPLEEIRGADGREVEFMVEENMLRWRYDGEEDWSSLFDLDDLRPADLREIELDYDAETVEWRFSGETEWRYLADPEYLDCAECEIESAVFNEAGLVEIALDDDSLVTMDSPRDAHMVRFIDPEGRLIDIVRVFHGEAVTPPAPPAVEGHVFEDWSESTERITGDRQIEALYEAEEFTVTYETYAEEDVPDATLAFGADLVLPVLEKEDHLFVGWYKDGEFRQFFNESTMPAEDLTLHARWVPLTGEDYEPVEAVEDMLERVLDGVVGVETEWDDGEETGTRSGSASVYRQEGDHHYLVTNHHVIEDYVSLTIYYEKNGNPYIVEDEDIEMLGSYEVADVAVLRFKAPHDFELLSFVDSYNLRIGNRVYAVGNPQGFGHYGSVTTGIISNLTRFMTYEDTIDAPFIQHDAAINPGNSGGPIIDPQGRIAGMNTLKTVGMDIEGMGYALPANTMVRMIEDIEEHGQVQRGRLGVSITHPDECAAHFGACIEEVSPDSTADEMGLEAGDVIIGYKMGSMNDFMTVYNIPLLREFVMNTRVGEELVIRYQRDGMVSETPATPLQAAD